jgi:ATP-dependent exoDNAse (exonuclease V) alpha subunit
VEVRGRAGREGRYFEVPGVPHELAGRWSARSEDIAAAARRFRRRFGREPRAGELGLLTTRTRGSKSAVASVEVDRAWRAVGEEYGLGAAQAERLFGDRPRWESRDVAGESVGDVCRERSVVSDRDLWARAYELSAGACRPGEARSAVEGLVAGGELVELEGGRWTTRELRDLERETLETARGRVDERQGMGSGSLWAARLSVERRLGVRLSAEQERALGMVCGDGGVSVLVGQAGTGKGVVVSAAREAWEAEGRRVLGTAVAGATAKRLAADCGIREAMTTDALLRRAENGRLELDGRSVVVMDEAGMADTRRLAGLVAVTERSGAKLVLVGDQAQLSSIGAGGLFGSLRDQVPTAELSEVHRARESWEREAWAQVRDGEAEHALASYESHDRLHVSDTRAQAGERMVGDWDRARREVGVDRCVMVTDASNVELDRLNALAQERRAQAGELGEQRVRLPGRPYGLAQGDEVIFTGSLFERGSDRVENGTRAQVSGVGGPDRVRLVTREPEPREVSVDTREFGELRLAYAQHVYKAQGVTVDRALVLCGGWQTDRERGYVALTRARERTDLYVCREDLGEDGMDAGAVQRLAGRLRYSRAQEASVTRAEVHVAAPGEGRRESEVASILRRAAGPDRDRGRGWD